MCVWGHELFSASERRHARKKFENHFSGYTKTFNLFFKKVFVWNKRRSGRCCVNVHRLTLARFLFSAVPLLRCGPVILSSRIFSFQETMHRYEKQFYLSPLCKIQQVVARMVCLSSLLMLAFRKRNQNYRIITEMECNSQTFPKYCTKVQFCETYAWLEYFHFIYLIFLLHCILLLFLLFILCC